jgi:hypothetical protein
MRKILHVIVLLSIGVISLFAQRKNSLPGTPGFVEFVSVSNQNKIELKTKSSENSIFALYGKHSGVLQQNVNSLLVVLLDSVMTKDATENYLSKEVYFRDSNERDTLIAQYTWNSSTTEWDLSAKNSLTHDSRGNITSSTNVLVFEGFSLGTSKYVTSYDANNNQTQHINYTWDFPASSWVASAKSESNYTNGKKMLDMDYMWVKATSSWKLNGKSDYSYDAKGYLILEIDSKLNNNTNQLENASKYVFSNDAAGRDTLSTEYRWASNTSTWDLYEKTSMTYTTNGALTSIVSYEWNSSTSLWVGLFKGVYAFDNAGNLASLVSYMWDEDLSAWVATAKTDFLYNANGNLTVDTSYMWSGNAWAKQSVSNYYYSPSRFSGLNEIDRSNGLMIYPNPVTDFLKINNLAKPATVSIASIDGRVIVYNRQLVENSIDVSKLKTGLYFLFIDTGDGKYTCKFVKR